MLGKIVDIIKDNIKESDSKLLILIRAEVNTDLTDSEIVEMITDIRFNCMK